MIEDSETYEQVTTGVLRTIAGRKEYTPRYKKRNPALSIPEPSARTLPLPSSIGELTYSRGCADTHALYLAEHDPLAHRRYTPKDIEARGVFNALERARYEALGGIKMRGVKGNLAQVMKEYCISQGFGAARVRSDIPAEEAMYILARCIFSEEKRHQDTQNVLDLWMPFISEHLGDKAFLGLKNALTDQKEFAVKARQFMRAIEMSGEDSASDDATDLPDNADIENPDEANHAEQEDFPQDEDTQYPQNEPAQGGDFNDGETEETDKSYEGEMQDSNVDNQEGGQGEMSARMLPDGRRGYIPGPEGFYTAYTTQFDEEVEAGDLADYFELVRLRKLLDQHLSKHQSLIAKLANRLQRKVMAQQQRTWQFDMEEGILDTARLSRIIANPNVPLTFKQEKDMPFRDTTVSLLIDNSGSMRGRPIATAAITTDLIARTLERVGVKTEILGFTTRAWKGGKARDLWTQNGRPQKPGRLNDLRHIIYKGADTPMRRARKNIGLMLKEGLLKENIDGEALVWAHNRISRRPEARKILMVISDGAPVDDSTLSVNPANYLEMDLRNVILWIEQKSPIELLAIGIGHDVTRYYKHAITIADVDQLAQALIGELVDLFDEN